MATPPEKTSFTYDFQALKPNDLIYQGDTQTALILTKTDAAGTPQQNSFGRVIYANPVLFTPQNKFETTIKFVVTPSAKADIIADGLAFFIVPYDYTFPNSTAGGSFGIFDESGEGTSVFAVEIDIYSNTWDPAFAPHVGIDIESRISKCVAQIPELYIGKEATLNISYDGATGLILVIVFIGGIEGIKLSYTYNLSEILPEKVKVGLAASTGDDVANFNVASWEFTSTNLVLRK